MPNILIKVKAVLHRLGPLLVAGIFVGAIWLLYREIRKYSLADIRISLARISTPRLLLSCCLTIVNYIVLIGYDWLALKGINRRLEFSRIALVSFAGQAVSFNFGALLGGSAVRYRLYSEWGFSAIEIVRLVLMLAIAFWVGAMGLVGILFLVAPPIIPPELAQHLPVQDIRPLGALLFAIAFSYLVICTFLHKPVHILGKEFAFPPLKIAIAQALVAGTDLIIGGSCLYVLLPPDAGIDFITFLPVYLLAMVMAVLSHVPGGAGVLEVIILHLTMADAQDVFAALLCFRASYYLLPLLGAACVCGVYEIRQQTLQKRGVLRDFSRWIHAFAPVVMAYMVFALGTLLCFSVVLPISPERFDLAVRWIPLQVMECASMCAGVSGAGLLFLAPGLCHRQKHAWRLVMLLLCVGVVSSVLYSLNWIMAVLLMAGIFCVWTVRERCWRSASLWRHRMSLRWVGGSLLVLASAAGLGLILHHFEVVLPDFWSAWEYTATGPRLTRVLTAEVFLILGLALGYARTAPLRRYNARRQQS